jgi:hypothetical protein
MPANTERLGLFSGDWSRIRPKWLKSRYEALLVNHSVNLFL